METVACTSEKKGEHSQAIAGAADTAVKTKRTNFRCNFCE